MFNGKSFNEKFLLTRKYYNFARVINCTRKLTCVCACACACNHTHLREQYGVCTEFYLLIINRSLLKNPCSNTSIGVGSSRYNGKESDLTDLNSQSQRLPYGRLLIIFFLVSIIARKNVLFLFIGNILVSLTFPKTKSTTALTTKMFFT